MNLFKYSFFSLLMIFLSCGQDEAQPVERPTSTPDQVTLTNAQITNAGIQVGSISMETMPHIIMLNGVVDVPPQNTISISFPMAAFLKSTSLLPGMPIRKGEIIAVMEDAALIQMQEDYLVAKSRLNYATLDYKRQQSLNETKTTSDKVYQQASTEYETQRVLVVSLAEKLRLVGIIPERLTESSISRRVTIHSPINGFVSKVHVNIGKYVQPSEVLFELINPDDLHAALTVFEKDIASVQPGQKVIVSFVDQPEVKISSTVFLVTRNVDESRTGIIHCHFDRQPPMLKPGMFLNAVLTISEAKVPAVPENAVVRFSGREFVFVQLASNQFRMTEVVTGERTNGLIELKDPQNLLDGTKIITSNAYAALSKLKNVSDE